VKRDIKKAIDQSHKLGADSIFYTSDIIQLRELAKNPQEGVDLYTAISNSLLAGYAIGYRISRQRAQKKMAQIMTMRPEIKRLMQLARNMEPEQILKVAEMLKRLGDNNE